MPRLIDIYLEKLKKSVVEMSSMVDEQVHYALQAVKEFDKKLAQKVIDMDLEVDKFDINIEKKCQKLFALNQPFAIDLRSIMSALSINNDLERIGDLAVNISERVLRLDKIPDFMEDTKFYQMTDAVEQMMKDSIDAYIHTDAELAKKVIAADDVLDDLNNENCNGLKELMKKDPKLIDEAIILFVLSRQMERIGDHCTNIAEDVYFIVEAQLIKHKFEKEMFLDEEE